MGMKVERTGIGGQGEVFGSVYVFRETWVIFFVRVIRKLTICFGQNRNFLISCARSLPSTSSQSTAETQQFLFHILRNHGISLLNLNVW